MSTETETVGGNFAISSPHFESLVGYVNDRGGKIFEEKQLKLEELGLAELDDQPVETFACLVCSSIIKRKNHAMSHFRKFHTNRNQTDFGTPENRFGHFEIDNSHLESLEAFVEVHGGQISVVRQLKFQDMDLAEVEGQKDQFQCLRCYKVIKRKNHAMTHFRKFHTEAKRIELKIQCPRCNIEMSKSDLNPHMEKEHGLTNFNQLMKRSFIPSNPKGVTSSNPGSVTKKTVKKKGKGDPLALAIEKAGFKDLNNNIKTEDIGATVNIKQE